VTALRHCYLGYLAVKAVEVTGPAWMLLLVGVLGVAIGVHYRRLLKTARYDETLRRVADARSAT
jgi:hypothetical protein